MPSPCGSAYPCAMASVVSTRAAGGLTVCGPGALRAVERSRLSCRFIKVRNVVRTRFFISSVKGGLITATRESFSAVLFTWAAISDRRTAVEPPMTVSRRMPAQVCSIALQKVKDTELLSFKLRWHGGVATRQAEYRLAAHCPRMPPSEPVKLSHLQREYQAFAASIMQLQDALACADWGS